MKLKFFVANVALTASLGLATSARAQTDWERAGVGMPPGVTPKYESQDEVNQRIRNDRIQHAQGLILRTVGQTNYSVVDCPLWTLVGGKVYEKHGDILVLDQTQIKSTLAFEAVKNYPGEAVLGQSIYPLALRVGTYDMNGSPIALYDFGKPYVPTPEQIAAARAAQEKAKADAKAKAAAQKADGAARALQANQDAAAKGDSFGLMRMGERYRDGDGVEKDLGKAREFLQKAADAGSPTAKEELSSLTAK